MLYTVACYVNRNKRIVKVENPQYKLGGDGDEELTLGVGPTVCPESLGICLLSPITIHNYDQTCNQWRRHTRGVGCVHTPCLENTYFLCT